ncbi:MAG: hypothetical protein LAO78_06340 [Acidobacteriia bacterium]|nr:hypothetical protein [Terriglobia bacterium]
MALDVTPVNRNLHTRVTFMALEFEDLFVVLGLAAVMNVVSRFVSGSLSAYLQYGVPLAVVPLLMVFKYGKPRGYLRDLLNWYTRPKAYCAVAHDRHTRSRYVKVEQ